MSDADDVHDEVDEDDLSEVGVRESVVGQDERIVDLLIDWKHRVEDRKRAHLLAATRLSARHYQLGVPAVVLSAIVGSTVFASLDTSIELGAKVAVGITSVLAAVLAALQTVLRYAERAEKHRIAAAQYNTIHRHIELSLATRELDALVEEAADIRARIDELETGAPDLTARAWREARQPARSFIGSRAVPSR
ncbi:Hypothetical protein I5071_77230 [Sandaracinus amylolyticus]|nr:Hypothetical protein I5071_77230 [Sandaracinus amylolyticus]